MTTVAVVGITALAAVLRLATLGDQSLWADEAVTAALVRKSFGGMLSSIPVTESTPPLDYVLEWAAVRIWGTGEAGLRLLSAVAGTLTVPVTYAATEVALVGRNPAPVALPGFQPTESLGAGNLTVRRLRATSAEIVRASDLPGAVGAVAR